MYRVRYYDQMIHPDHFRAGLLGFTIRVLNTLRWKLEVVVQRLVLKYVTKEGGVPQQEKTTLMKMFELDVATEELERYQTSPLLPAKPVDQPRSDRYEGSGGISRALESASGQTEEPPYRPKPADEMIARYMDPRRARYARGRKYMLTADEGNFEPVIADKE